MTKERCFEIVKKMDISRNMDSYDIETKLEELGLDREVSCSHGVTKMCLIFKDTDFVLKWTKSVCWFSNAEKDEAYEEYEIYLKAKEKGLEKMFPYTELLGRVNNIPIILQEKIDFSCDDCPYPKTVRYKEITKTAKQKVYFKMCDGFWVQGCCYNRELNELWAKMTLILYGKNFVKKLCEFIQENRINDLHGSNLGYKNNKPIILDFSGFYR